MYEEELRIYNKNSNENFLRLVIRLFVDDGSLGVKLGEITLVPGGIPEENDAENKIKDKEKEKEKEERKGESKSKSDTEACLCLDYGTIYLEAVKRPFLVEGGIPEMRIKWPSSSARVTIHNRTDEDMILTPKTNLKSALEWLPAGQGSVQEVHPVSEEIVGGSYHICGAEYTLLAGHTVEARVSVPALPSEGARLRKMSTSGEGEVQISALLARGVIAPIKNGILLLERRKKEASGETRICKALTMQGSYCLSTGRLEGQALLSVGKITSVWQIMPFSFQIRNLSEAPLVYRIEELPPYIVIEGRQLPAGTVVHTLQEEGREVSLITVAPLAVLRVAAEFHSSKVQVLIFSELF